MREVINAVTSATGGASLTGAATGQLMIAGATFILFVAFGVWGAYWKYQDSKAIREALKSGNLEEAIKLNGKK